MPLPLLLKVMVSPVHGPCETQSVGADSLLLRLQHELTVLAAYAGRMKIDIYAPCAISKLL